MARILKREAAKRDLIVQWVWYAENANIEIADRFLLAADRALSLIAKQPEIGSGLFVGIPCLTASDDFLSRTGLEKYYSCTSHCQTELTCFA